MVRAQIKCIASVVLMSFWGDKGPNRKSAIKKNNLGCNLIELNLSSALKVYV
jgi:hypothetical protein